MISMLKDSRGNVAIIFAFSLLPLVGFAGAAIDYSRANSVKENLRTLSDQVAVTVAASDNPNAAAEIQKRAEAMLLQSASHDFKNFQIHGHWLDGANYKVTLSADVPVRILSGVPGMPRYISASAVTIAHRIAPRYRTLPPNMSMLDPEAGDYNRIYMYCFNPDRINEADKGRGKPVPIADNASMNVYDSELPQCEAGEFIGYKLRNVRGARAHPSRWDDPAQAVYEYYTDTVIDRNTRTLQHDVKGYRVHNGTRRDSIDMSRSSILETVLCRNEKECRPQSQGGVIPNRRTGRTPLQASQACEEGMFMYFGWEDRPSHPSGHPHHGWTDEDFDDIRLIVSCPEVIQETDKQVRIVY